MNTRVDQAIAEIPAESVAPETPIEPVAADEVAQPETEGEPEAPKVDEDVPFPKKAVNAISRRDKQIGSLKAEKQALAARIAELEAKQTPQGKDNSNGPSEDDFDNYAEYLKAVARHEAKQELEQGKKAQEQSQSAEKEQLWVAQREDYIAEQANKIIESSPELKQLVEENADILDSFPYHVSRAFLEAENAPLAFIALAKEGKLEQLATMSPMQVAAVIAKAELRGEALIKTKPITKAPVPMSSAKGTGAGAKSLDNMSPDEIRGWLKS
jgi:hypothetical protein